MNVSGNIGVYYTLLHDPSILFLVPYSNANMVYNHVSTKVQQYMGTWESRTVHI